MLHAPASSTPQRQPHPRRAFSLLEVVVAIGIFAVGMVAVIGLFVPVARSVSNASDAEAAAHLPTLLRAELTRRVIHDQSFHSVTALLKNSTARSHQLTDADNNPNAPTSDPRRDPQRLFASRDGTRIGAYDDALWIDPVTRRPSDADKFFEIALIRNETLSPNDPAADAAAIVLAYTARVRSPAFVPDPTPTNPRRALPSGYNPTGTVVLDHGQQQVLHFAGAVSR